MILLQLVLIALNAVFACAEIAVIQFNDAKLAKMSAEGDKRAVRLEQLTSQPARFLATIQVAITLSGFLGSAFAAENFSDPIVQALLNAGLPIPESTLNSIVVILITIILSYFTLVFGELVPKRVAMRKAEKLALGMSGMISGISRLFAPLVSLLTASTNLVLRLMGIDPNEEDEEVSEEEIRMMVDVGSEKGAIDNDEKEFIENVFEFDDITAGEVVTHRTDITVLFTEESDEEWKQTIYESRYTLYPVCEDSADNIIGILHAKEYLRLEDKRRENVMEKAVKPAYYVPENVKADILFRNMKTSHNRLAVVLDEYGGMCGIVTMNDLVELLVGDLGDDENQEDKADDSIEQIGERTWKIAGRALLEEVEQLLGIDLPDEDYETFNGYIFSFLGTVPQDGTTMDVETDLMLVHITDILDHQIESAVVEVKEQPVVEEEEDS
ncbi:MAG: HlyC/CorC family transporter [Oscillospiraceae bacterium]|nr:HlyC/CorC family transporter [Oscillospiraceae bacterium]